MRPLACTLLVCTLFACDEREPTPRPPPALSAAGSSTVVVIPSALPDVPSRPAPPREGMVWVSKGALVAGTPPGAFPRIADEEMPGQQVILRGFYIDVFPYPNEQGAIPLTNVSQEEAAAHCEEQNKRLCTELEWERACKGPSNSVYEYGNQYQADVCNTGAPPAMLPSGMRYACRSEFGARDMHGGVWEWTASPWGRGSQGMFSLRGGNSTAGQLVGRCANAAPSKPNKRAGVIGFRCCAGPANDAEVVLHVRGGNKLDYQEPPESKLARRLEKLLPEEARKELDTPDDFKVDRTWTWRPIGNEELIVAGGCSGFAKQPSCGVLVVRILLDRPTVLAWAGSGHWAPRVVTDMDPRDLWLFGGDDRGSYRRLLGYVWGKVSVGHRERKLKPQKKPKKR